MLQIRTKQILQITCEEKLFLLDTCLEDIEKNY